MDSSMRFNIYSKYLRRPDAIRDICFAQFAKMFRSKSSNEDENTHQDDECLETADKLSMENDAFMKFNYIITFDEKNNLEQVLPKIIKLKDAFPGEPRTMQRRQFPAALR